jgi:hypothetical protein
MHWMIWWGIGAAATVLAWWWFRAQMDELYRDDARDPEWRQGDRD